MDAPSSIKSKKRAFVHRTGKKLLRRIGSFQDRHSLVATTPVLSNDSFPWVSDLEDNWQVIRKELEGVMQHPEDIPTFHQISPDQGRISKGDNWKTYTFYAIGARIDDNCAECPVTAELLDKLPNLQNAWFSILAPRYHIPPHKGPTKAFIRCHLGLQVPKEREKCWIRVDEEICYWEEGKCLVFDDTYEHEVLNDTDEWRVVLFLDFDRPMDRIGTWFNQGVLGLIRSSHYFKDPMKNITNWNQRLKERNRTTEG